MTSESQTVEPKKSDFSIEHILNRAGEKSKDGAVSDLVNFGGGEAMVPVTVFPWLQCTRYCPPKIPRRREAPQKRQLGRHPRIPFTCHQLSVLEEKFQQSPYLSSEEVTRISRDLELADVRVKIWFQNRRARERRERALLEEGGNNAKLKEGMNSNYNTRINETSVIEQEKTPGNIFMPVYSAVSEIYSSSLRLTQPRNTFQT